MIPAKRNPYASAQVNSASPEQILVLLYDAALRDLKEAMAALQVNDRSRKAKALDHAVKVVTELANSLRPDKSPEIAENLSSLYDFMIDRMIRSNAQNQDLDLQVVYNLLGELRSAWVEAIRINRTQRNQGVAGA
ncbi:MAG: flagellar export chaperone FliS [Myxococcota bacterium]|jgi:flagellar protein FliS|nr:flagellar export chaperone FliS [Myxococcota bacterium]